jgi:hypothetical protein
MSQQEFKKFVSKIGPKCGQIVQKGPKERALLANSTNYCGVGSGIEGGVGSGTRTGPGSGGASGAGSGAGSGSGSGTVAGPGRVSALLIGAYYPR